MLDWMWNGQRGEFGKTRDLHLHYRVDHQPLFRSRAATAVCASYPVPH